MFRSNSAPSARRRLGRWWFAAIAVLPLTAALAATQYLYDDLGRLVLVANSDGSAAVYAHDENGNVLSISQWAASGPVIAGFSPMFGHVGSSVTILGAGFSATPTNNTVTIGGVAATVASATATTIVSSIPQGADTGPITVTVGGVTAVSAHNITVYKPLIVSFSPALVAPGASVTVIGANMNLVSGGTSISVGGTTATITSLSNTQAVITAPTGSAGGRIVVNTPYGQAQSATNLVIVPTSIGAANVVAQAAIQAGGAAASVAINQQNKYALLQFEAAASSFYSVQVNSLTTTPANASVSWQVFSPAGASVGSGSFSSNSPSIHLPKTTAAGQYLVSFASGASTSVQVTAAVELNPTLSAGASSVSVSTTAVRQTKRMSFNATAGDDLSLTLTGLSLTPSSPNGVRVYITRPDNYYNYFPCYSTSTPGCSTDTNYQLLTNAPLTGTYTVLIEPQSASTMTFNIGLSQDVTGALTPGTPLAVTLPEAGRQAMLTFAATAGETKALTIGSIATTPAGRNVTAIVYRSNGTHVTSATTSSQTTLNLPNLAADTYSVWLVPASAATATLQATLANGVGAPLQADGSTQSFSTTLPGQNAYFTFNASAGDDLSLALTGLSLTPSSPNNVRVYITRPDNYYNYFPCYTTSSPGCSTDTNYALLTNAPATGTYKVTVEPQGPSTMSFNLTLSQDVSGALTPGTPLAVSLPEPGRQAMLTFTATAGETKALTVGSIATTPAGKSVTVIVYRSNGTHVTSATTSAQTTLNMPNLAAGTYSVWLVPAAASTATLQATLANGVSAALPSNGSTQSFSTTLPGQNAYFTFSATAGDDMSLVLTNLSVTPSSPNYVRVWITRPDGYYGSFYCYTTGTPGCVTNNNNVPLYNLLTGTYSVTVEPQPGSTMSFGLALHQDVTGALTDGMPLTVSLPEIGRQAMLTFSASAAQTMALNVGSLSTTPAGKSVTMLVMPPNGGSFTASGTTSTQATWNFTTTVAGTYSVYLAPADAATASLQATLANGVAATLTPNGSTQSFSTSLPGQHAYFKFSGTAGDDLSLALTNLLLTPSSPNNVRVYVTRPDGYYNSFWCYTTTTPGCVTYPGGYSLMNLPVTGQYSVQVEAQGPSTMSFDLTLSQNLTGALTAGTPLSVSLPEPGRQALLTFTATAGQSVTLRASSIATTPAGKSMTMYVFNPAGSQISSASGTSTINRPLTNLAAGTYSVLLYPYDAATATTQVSIQ